jgi:hypothetical protein
MVIPWFESADLHGPGGGSKRASPFSQFRERQFDA